MKKKKNEKYSNWYYRLNNIIICYDNRTLNYFQQKKKGTRLLNFNNLIRQLQI